MELEEQREALAEQGLGIAAISYDSEEILSEFAERRGITIPLLSDDDSRAITDYGILNTVAAEGLGENADDPDVVADVQKYVSVFGAGEMMVGTPFPGTFMVDGDGVVTARFFEEFYRERTTTASVMLQMGAGLSPIAAIEGSTGHLSFVAYPSNPSVTVGTRFSIAIDIEPHENMHLYAPGAEEMGYNVIGLNLDPVDLVRFESVRYPESETYHFEPLDETVPAYIAPFTLMQEAVVSGEAGVEDALREMDALTISGSLDYQACDDALCFPPVSVPISFALDIDLLDRQRAGRD